MGKYVVGLSVDGDDDVNIYVHTEAETKAKAIEKAKAKFNDMAPKMTVSCWLCDIND